MNVDEAKKVLQDAGYVVVKAKSYRRAQERQRIADALCADAQQRAASQDKWWREEILPELFRYRDRVTHLYGAARAAGATAAELGWTVVLDDRNRPPDVSAQPIPVGTLGPEWHQVFHGQ